MNVFWWFSYGLLGSSLIEWAFGVPPSIILFGVMLYPQMLISLLVVIFCFANRPPPPMQSA